VKRTVFYVSDGTGITAETLGHAMLTQFDGIDFSQITRPFVDSAEKAADVIEAIANASRVDGIRPIVFSTLVHPELAEQIGASDALVLDLFSVFIEPLEREFGRRSTHTTGKSHGMVDWKSYNSRINAVNFALQHDDGASTKHYPEADVILIGVSRSGKTPTSLYLAMHFGVRAANYPITADDLEGSGLPGPLAGHRERLFGLTIDAERLRQIRSERRPNSRYASLAQCRQEVREVESLFRSSGIPCLNTTAISVEEIASRLLQDSGIKRRVY